jgi:hypothetical protein
LKKRTKQLLPLAGNTNLALLNRMPGAMSQSFLLLFFKKEVFLSCRSVPVSNHRWF